MAKQNKQNQTGSQEKPVIKEGKETPTPTPPKNDKDKK